MYWSNYAETAILNTFREITAVAPPTLYMGLMTVAPTGLSDGTEVTYDGYTRQIITFSAPTQDTNLYGEGKTGMSNLNECIYPVLPVDVGTAVGVGFYNSLVGGNLLAYATVVGGITLDENEEVWLRVGDIIADISGDFTNYFNEKCLNYLRGESIIGFKSFSGLSSSSSEFTGDTYIRQLISFNVPDHGSNESSYISNSNEITFPEPTQDWGILSKHLICDSETNGNTIISKDITKSTGESISKEIKIGYTIRTRVGKLIINVN